MINENVHTLLFIYIIIYYELTPTVNPERDDE